MLQEIALPFSLYSEPYCLSLRLGIERHAIRKTKEPALEAIDLCPQEQALEDRES